MSTSMTVVQCAAVRRLSTMCRAIARRRRFAGWFGLGPVRRLDVKRRLLCCLLPAARCLDVGEDVPLANPPADAGALNLVQVDPVLARHPQDDRGIEPRSVCLRGPLGRLCRLRTADCGLLIPAR